MWTYFLIIITSILILIFQKKYKIIGSDFWILFIECILLLFTVNNPDYNTYKSAYISGYGPFFEKGIFWIKDIFSYIYLDHYIFLLFAVFIIIFISFYLWRKEIPKIYIVIFLYSLFCMYYDVIQIRYTIAQFLIIISLYFLIKDKKYLCLLFCFLAPQFHRMTLILVFIILYLLLFNYSDDYSISFKELIILTLIGIGGVFFSKILINLIATKIPYFQRINLYMLQNISIDSLIIWVGHLILILIILYWFGVRKVLSSDSISIQFKKDVNLLYRFAFFGISTMGLLLYMNEFNRAYRSFYIISYLLFGKIQHNITSKNRCILFLLMSFINVIFMVIAMNRGLLFDNYW